MADATYAHHKKSAMNYPQPYTPPIAQAVYKKQPSDFVVKENLEIEFSQAGEHLWLYLHKTNLNTTFVAKLLAEWAGVNVRDVGYSGLKDRRADTWQWFSIRLPSQTLPTQEFGEFIKNKLRDDEYISIERQHWHTRKLHRGTHKSNHFTITLRDVIVDASAVQHTVSQIAQMGVPNYFGEQRFGRDGDNVAKAVSFFARLGTRPYRPNKRTAERDGLLISAARSDLFNQLLARRVAMNCWCRAIDGDAFNLNGTGSIFTALLDDNIRTRLEAGDIHPIAPLYGVGTDKVGGEAQALYQQILTQPNNQPLIQGLQAVRAQLSYRPLRLMVNDLQYDFRDGVLTLSFCLPKGSFATVVLAALVVDLVQGVAVN